MFIVNDIKTGFTKLGRGTPSTWTKTKLVCPPSGHTQNIIYKDIGTTSGYIEFDYKIDTTESFSGHCIFRIRSEHLVQGQYYNDDTFSGVELIWWGENNAPYRRLDLQEKVDGVKNILHEFDTNIANKTLRIKVLWDKKRILVSVDGVEVEFFNKIKNDYTYIDFGFANYAGTITRTIKNIIPPTVDVSDIDDKLHININNGNCEVNSIDILYNNVIIETIQPTDSYTHDIDKKKISIGDNNITIRVNSDFIVPIYKTIKLEYKLELLQSTSNLLDVVDYIKSISITNEIEYNLLKEMLIDKNIEVLKDDKMLSLINKVGELPSMETVSQLQENQVDITNRITSLEEENQALREELTQIQTSIASLTSLITATLEEK